MIDKDVEKYGQYLKGRDHTTLESSDISFAGSKYVSTSINFYYGDYIDKWTQKVSK